MRFMVVCRSRDRGIVEWDSIEQTWSATAFLSLIYFEILGLTMEDGEPVFHPQLPINCGHMRIRGFEVAGWLFDLDIDGERGFCAEAKDFINNRMHALRSILLS